jgi:hypothetical protein
VLVSNRIKSRRNSSKIFGNALQDQDQDVAIGELARIQHLKMKEYRIV